MFTNEQSDYLLKLPKKIISNDLLLDSTKIIQKYPFCERFILGSQQDLEFSFLLEVYQSEKAGLKISVHYQEDQSKVGLLRIDYNSTHKNPEIVSNDLPLKFHKYAGKWFEYNEHHIHYYFQNYKPLAWALPLVDDDFPIKEIKNNQDASEAFLSFCKRINLITTIELETILI